MSCFKILITLTFIICQFQGWLKILYKEQILGVQNHLSHIGIITKFTALEERGQRWPAAYKFAYLHESQGKIREARQVQ